MSSKRKPKDGWNAGPPPSVGWWPASISFDPHTIRWWNGNRWSVAVRPHESPERAGFWASVKNTGKETIYWAERPHYWPEISKT